MSRWHMHHPDDGELLRYADGELPARQARRVRRHLEACWRCRAEIQRIQEAVGECVRYREEMLVRYAPPPPEPWPDIYRGFADIDATPGNTSWGDVLRGFLQLPARHARRWVPAAVMLVLAVVGYYRFRGAPPVEARPAR